MASAVPATLTKPPVSVLILSVSSGSFGVIRSLWKFCGICILCFRYKFRLRNGVLFCFGNGRISSRRSFSIFWASPSAGYDFQRFPAAPCLYLDTMQSLPSMHAKVAHSSTPHLKHDRTAQTRLMIETDDSELYSSW